ncbi:MAG: hypothetical protein D3910_12245 [Candidatus Electrothrix sp. ATG2]|nr:hypothetical protein [Candidatus Electrothrix sp. ATG2]
MITSCPPLISLYIGGLASGNFEIVKRGSHETGAIQVTETEERAEAGMHGVILDVVFLTESDTGRNVFF